MNEERNDFTIGDQNKNSGQKILKYHSKVQQLDYETSREILSIKKVVICMCVNHLLSY